MKKEFSFYEFVGILVPGVTVLFCSEIAFEFVNNKQLLDFSKLGESAMFLILSYAVGHVLHAAGNILEVIMWWLLGGMPSNWLVSPNRFGKQLFSIELTKKIEKKISDKLGLQLLDDCGLSVYNWLSLKDNVTEKRIDVFNANYSMFRGLSVSFYLLTGIIIVLINFKLALLPFLLGILSSIRMYRFAVLYAKEVFRTFLYID
jgi:hypothetical protein